MEIIDPDRRGDLPPLRHPGPDTTPRPTLPPTLPVLPATTQDPDASSDRAYRPNSNSLTVSLGKRARTQLPPAGHVAARADPGRGHHADYGERHPELPAHHRTGRVPRAAGRPARPHDPPHPAGPPAARGHGQGGRRHRRRRPDPTGAAHGGRRGDRPAGPGPQRHAGPDRDGLRPAGPVRGPPPQLPRRRLPRAAHPVHLHPGLRRAPAQGRPRGRDRTGTGPSPASRRRPPAWAPWSATWPSWPARARAPSRPATASTWLRWPPRRWPTPGPSTAAAPSTSTSPGEVPVFGDDARLEQMVHNLVGNALAHTPDGHPGRGRVAVRDERAVLEVSDRGPGMTADQADHVFDRFYRGTGTGMTGDRVSACSSWPPWPAPSAARPRSTRSWAGGRPSGWSSRSSTARPAPSPQPESMRHAEEAASVLASIDRGTGPPVVLLHGQPGSGASWDPVTDAWSRTSGCWPLTGSATAGPPARPGGWPPTPTSSRSSSPHEGRGRPPWWPTAGRGAWPCCWPPATDRLVQGLVLVGAACTPDSLNALDRWLTSRVVGDALTVVGSGGHRGGTAAPAAAGPVPAGALPPTAGHRPARPAGPGRGPRRARSAPADVHGRAAGPHPTSCPRWWPPSATSICRSRWSRAGGTWWCRPAPRRPWPGRIPGAELTILPRAGHFVARDDPDALAEVIRRTASVPDPVPNGGALGRRRGSAHRPVDRGAGSGREADPRGQGVESGGQLEEGLHQLGAGVGSFDHPHPGGQAGRRVPGR